MFRIEIFLNEMIEKINNASLMLEKQKLILKKEEKSIYYSNK